MIRVSMIRVSMIRGYHDNSSALSEAWGFIGGGKGETWG